MTPRVLASHLSAQYHEYCLHDLRPTDCKPGRILTELQTIVGRAGSLFTLTRLGESLEGRSINLVSCGSGKTRVLLWSQMHGDETTATLALLDIFSFLEHEAEQEKWVRTMLSEITIAAIPMLNPDGAERCQRHTASQIDMNRDARAEVTPEAKLLHAAHRKVSPAFGFNLHDQGLSSVGNTPNVAALALLAPPSNEGRSVPLSRVRAMRVAALMAQALEQFIKKHLTSYDDTFEPRAFGDGMQSWGTSTVLIESGHWPKDPEKAFIRKLNFIAILTALHAIGNKSYQDTDLEYYSLLPKNGKRIYHYIIRDVQIEYADGSVLRADIGLELDPKKNFPLGDGNTTPAVVTVREIGDLKGFGALQVFTASGRKVHASMFTLDESIVLDKVLDQLQLYHGR